MGGGVLLWQKVEALRTRNKRREQRKEEFGKDPRELSCGKRSREFLAEIAVYYEEMKEQDGEGAICEENLIDDVTWNDLDMDELFLRINHTKSYIGEQTLYRRLHETKERDWGKWEKHLSYFSQKEKEREELEEALWRIGKEREAYYLPMFLKNADGLVVEHLWIYRMLQFLLFSSLFVGILPGNPLFLGISGVTALINVSVYVMSRDKYEVYLYSLGSVRELLAFHKLLAKREEWRELFATEELITAWERTKDLWYSIGRYQGKKRAALSGDAFAVFADYLSGATLRDITAFGHIAKQLTEKERELFLLYEAAGEIDLEIAVSSFRQSLAVWCVPEPRGQDSTAGTAHRKGQSVPRETDVLRAKGMYHPLLRHPVCNDFVPGGCCLITGANATGKSTFGKAVAVNAILAQTIHTCTAERFSMQKMRVLTSMAVRDDLVEGKSYYIREISYLKRIVDAVGGRLPVLCVIDEILRGTNTPERLAASQVICRYLAGKNCLAVIATHDIELTRRLSADYRSYYFSSGIEGNEVCFDYKMHEGVGENRNAIKLLGLMGFPEEIVTMAQAICG